MNRAESMPTPATPQPRFTPALPRDEVSGSISSKVKPGHLARKAVVYVRQSTTQQVLNHRESTDRQYALDRRAVQLGWAAESVITVDEDQGRSGTTARLRLGQAACVDPTLPVRCKSPLGGSDRKGAWGLRYLSGSAGLPARRRVRRGSAHRAPRRGSRTPSAR